MSNIRIRDYIVKGIGCGGMEQAAGLAVNDMYWLMTPFFPCPRFSPIFARFRPRRRQRRNFNQEGLTASATSNLPTESPGVMFLGGFGIGFAPGIGVEPKDGGSPAWIQTPIHVCLLNQQLADL
jgi:hypothetical protein